MTSHPGQFLIHDAPDGPASQDYFSPLEATVSKMEMVRSGGAREVMRLTLENKGEA